MKKITLFLFAIAFSSVITAQTTVQSENFTTYLGTSVTVPTGWTFTYNGNYTTTASSGTSGPNSYKFGQSVGAPPSIITSPMFTLADSLSFWMKGNSTDTISTFYVRESADNITWDTIAIINPINTAATGMTLGFPVSPTSHYISFVYAKSAGNVAFDDYRLFLTGPMSVENHNNSASLTVSPNPSSGIFNLNLNNASKAQITVFDITGKKILQKETSVAQQSIDLSAQPDGSYFITVKTDKELTTKKIIIVK
ncbi:MAG: Ig domain protein group 2 domain protein [Bacteroidota bacterium]|jgi:hypothetical protein|nr:Ig domain protein group 2 domain protein [Bacteroidota bacterium]